MPSLHDPSRTSVPSLRRRRGGFPNAMVFGKRDTKPDALTREDVVGNLYPDTLSSEVDVTPSPSEFRRPEAGNESVIDPHARFNGKYVSDRDLRIEGEAQGEIECQGTLIISPQARVRSAITAHNVIINGDYEGDVDCGGRFEIGATGRVRRRWGQRKSRFSTVSIISTPTRAPLDLLSLTWAAADRAGVRFGHGLGGTLQKRRVEARSLRRLG